MKVQDAMTPNVGLVAPDSTAMAAAQLMRDLDVGALPVGNGETGPITLRIAETYRRVVGGRDDRHPEWRTPVWTRRQ